MNRNSISQTAGLAPHAHSRGALVVLGFLLGAATAFSQSAEDLRLTVGKSVVIDYPSDIRQISTSSPDIVDASPVTTREILLHGKGLGNATLVVWSKTGERTFYNVTVDLNLDSLRKILKDSFPNEQIVPESSRDSLTLNGKVSSKEVADRAIALASTFAKTVVNNLDLGTPPVDKQVLLRVRFAELDRAREEQYGVNLFGQPGQTQAYASTQQSPISSTTIGSVGGAAGPECSHDRICAEHLRIQSQAEPGRVHPSAPDRKHFADPGRAESGDHQRQGSLLPGGRRVPGSGAARWRQRGVGNRPIQGIWHSLALHPGRSPETAPSSCIWRRRFRP